MGAILEVNWKLTARSRTQVLHNQIAIWCNLRTSTRFSFRKNQTNLISIMCGTGTETIR